MMLADKPTMIRERTIVGTVELHREGNAYRYKILADGDCGSPMEKTGSRYLFIDE